MRYPICGKNFQFGMLCNGCARFVCKDCYKNTICKKCKEKRENK